MHSKKRALLLSLAGTVILGLSSGSAHAAPAAWMLHGKTFTEEGITTTAVKTTAKTDKNAVLSGSSLTITCSGNSEALAPTIHEKDISSTESLILTSCSMSPVTCKVPTTIGTVPVSLEGTLDGTSATKGIIKPTTGTVFTTIAVTGPECSAAGNKPVSGDFEMLSPEGQLERTDQLEEVHQSATGLLKLGSSAASMSGSVLALLTNNQSWSFL